MWGLDGSEAVTSLVARTGSGDVVLGLRFPAMPSCPMAGSCWLFGNERLLVLHHDGSTTEVPGRYLTDW